MTDNAAPSSPVSPAPNAAPANAPPLAADPGQSSPAMLAQHRESVIWAMEHGHVSREKAEAELKRVGAEAISPPSTPAPAARAEGQGEPLAGLEGGKAGDYQLGDISGVNEAVTADSKTGTGGQALTAAETVKIQETVGGWLSAGAVPPQIGAFISKEAAAHIKAMPRYESMSDSERQAYRLGQEAKVAKQWGKDAAQNIEHARAAVQWIEAKQPGLVSFLERTGLGDNANIILQMGLHGKRLAARK